MAVTGSDRDLKNISSWYPYIFNVHVTFKSVRQRVRRVSLDVVYPLHTRNGQVIILALATTYNNKPFLWHVTTKKNNIKYNSVDDPYKDTWLDNFTLLSLAYLTTDIDESGFQLSAGW